MCEPSDDANHTEEHDKAAKAIWNISIQGAGLIVCAVAGDHASVRLKLAETATALRQESPLVERLAREQGIQPVKSMNDLRGEPMSDAEFDAFFDAAMSSRIRN